MKATILILILMFVTACAVDAQESTSQAVTDPNAHCVLCGGDDDSGGGTGGTGGGGGGGCAATCSSDADCWGCPATYSCVYDGSGSGLGKTCAFNVVVGG